MSRPLSRILLLVCCSLSGCVAVDSISVRSANHSSPASDEQQISREFNLNDPAEREAMLASIDHVMMRDEVAATPRGSQVGIEVDFDRRFTGTLLNTGKDDVELMNCICREIVPGPKEQRQCKTSHVPFQSLKISSMSRFHVISPPPPDFALPDLSTDAGRVSVAEIVYKSGHRQRWGHSPESDESDHESNNGVFDKGRDGSKR